VKVKVSPPDQRRDKLETVFPGHFRGRSECGFFIGMKIKINGEEKEVIDGVSIAGLLEQLQIRAGRVVIEHNRNILARDAYGATPLSDGDTLEIVHFVGGG
jgi:sulfur carrier protein